MTLQEVSQILGQSQNNMYKNFYRTQKNLKKYGIIVTKWGRGKETEYFIEYEEQEEEIKEDAETVVEEAAVEVEAVEEEEWYDEDDEDYYNEEFYD